MKSKYSLEILQPIVASSESVMEVLRRLGLRATGGSHAQIKRLIAFYGLDTRHFLGQGGRKGKPTHNKYTANEVLVLRLDRIRPKASQLRRALIEAGVTHECAECHLPPLWKNQRLVLQVDHINGDTADNRQDNLRFLCPNCHSQTETFGVHNKQALVVQLVDTLD